MCIRDRHKRDLAHVSYDGRLDLRKMLGLFWYVVCVRTVLGWRHPKTATGMLQGRVYHKSNVVFHWLYQLSAQKGAQPHLDHEPNHVRSKEHSSCVALTFLSGRSFVGGDDVLLLWTSKRKGDAGQT